MKFLICFVVSLALFGLLQGSTEVGDGPQLRDFINDTIETIKKSIPEPIELANLTIELPSPLEGYIGAEKITLNGVNQLVATYTKLNIIPIGAELTILVPAIKLTIENYAAQIGFANISLPEFSGNLNVDMQNIQIGVDAQVSLSPFGLSKLVISINTDTLELKITGIISDEISDLVSQMLSNTLAPFLNDFAGLISEVVSPILMDIINSLLQQQKIQKEIEPFVEIIKNYQQ